MVQLQQNLKELEATGGQIVGVSYDSVEILKRFADKSAITFPLLSDLGSKPIDAYGLRHPEGAGRLSVIPYRLFPPPKTELSVPSFSGRL